ncbi:MAG: choice-of-anchor J domain-containing protein [Urechidicola sp.]|nr:choice-of-anchor J domain-containing protein [Urechidicola sp.]
MKKITLLSMLFFFAICIDSFAQFSESFDTEIPGTWTILNEDGGANTWVHQTQYPQAGAGHARITYESGAHEDYLITPQFMVTSGVSERITFYAGIDGTFWTETFDVKLSTTGVTASDFTTTIASETATTDADGDYTQYSYDLSAYDGQNVYIAIVATDTDRFYLYVDEFVNDTQPTDTPDWYNIQWINDNDNATGSNTSLTTDAWTSVTVYAQVWEDGVTDPAGQAAGIECWIGGNDNNNTDPSTWAADEWEVADYNGDAGNNDEYKLDAVLEFSGTVYIAARWRYNGGPFVYGGYNGPWNGTTNNNIELIVNPIVANDNCGAAIALTVNTDLNCGSFASGTLENATESGDGEGCSGSFDDDVWYSFVAVETEHEIQANNISGSTTDLVFQLAEGTCGSLTELDCHDTPNSGFTATGLTPTSTYYIRVASYTSTGGQDTTFDICVGTPPPPPPVPANDECANADPVTSLPYNTSLDASSATNNAGFISCDGGSDVMNDGVWYTFIPGSDGTLDIALTNVVGWDPEIRLFSGSCGTFTCEANADSGGTGGDETLSSVSVTTGTQYWINVGQWSGTTDNSEGPFDLDITTSDGVTLQSLSVEDNIIEGFSIYPNPVNDVLRLRALDNINEINIYNLLGQEVLRAQPRVLNTQVDIADLPTGIYVVKVQIGKQFGAYRIVKE